MTTPLPHDDLYQEVMLACSACRMAADLAEASSQAVLEHSVVWLALHPIQTWRLLRDMLAARDRMFAARDQMFAARDHYLDAVRQP